VRGDRQHGHLPRHACHQLEQEAEEAWVAAAVHRAQGEDAPDNVHGLRRLVSKIPLRLRFQQLFLHCSERKSSIQIYRAM
jgi:hypothetical protein